MSPPILQDVSGAPPSDKPMMRQYLTLKAEHPDAYLFFRVGDFYELFFDDARAVAEALDLVLTSRHRDSPDSVPMCGVPWRSVDGYVRRLVDMGHKVALADQMEDPSSARGLVDRSVIRVVSPGVVLDPEGLDAHAPNYLAGIVDGRDGRWGLAFLDVSTGDIRVTEHQDVDAATTDLARLQPREVVLPDDLPEIEAVVAALAGCRVERTGRDFFAHGAALRLLHQVFGVANLDGFGAQNLGPALDAAGAVLRYGREVSHTDLGHVKRLRVYQPAGHLVLDAATRANLEIDRPLRGSGRKGTLLHLLDRTMTGMGGRLLREWVAFPLLDPEEIRARQDAVQALYDSVRPREALRGALRSVADVERIGSKITQKTVTPRDLGALRQSLEAILSLLSALRETEVLADALGPDLCEDIAADVKRHLVDEPPISPLEGGLLRAGLDPVLDELTHLAFEGKGEIAEMERRERASTGIGSLRIGHHRTFGFTIEVTRPNLDKVPAHYRRVLTMTNADRFTTVELQDFEEKVTTADAKRKSLEYEIFCALRDRVGQALPRLQALSARVAFVDVLAALADLAVQQRYTRPEVTGGEELDLSEARHPVVETSLSQERFVPNDLVLDPASRQFVILTGPNMSGKSTVMRQVALIVLLAQMGSFVPARHAKLGAVDRIFVRVGASDDLARGRSTFMVEMAETANILHHATRRSLVLLDEIGRGTSTYDGLAIAWAVAEVLHDRTRCRTLFATHYHELVGFARKHPRAVNLRVAVNQQGERIIFLRKLQDGATSRSYGIQCARLAGMPEPVVNRARELLAELERRRPRDDRQLVLFSMDPDDATQDEGALADEPHGEPSRLSQPRPEPAGSDIVRDALRALDPNAMTPREAMEAIYRLKGMI
jgi:DNA mismatch repair protein MutS